MGGDSQDGAEDVVRAAGRAAGSSLLCGLNIYSKFQTRKDRGMNLGSWKLSWWGTGGGGRGVGWDK